MTTLSQQERKLIQEAVDLALYELRELVKSTDWFVSDSIEMLVSAEEILSSKYGSINPYAHGDASIEVPDLDFNKEDQRSDDLGEYKDDE